ncbi:hypothetical protein GIB67_036784 [Kingdonia uniflora]|uniref:Uncharacterized protein n=1 Tax=Kingdonia uniflora TaxID=39325 RepID=A0A7J7LWS5_9MAGN|nr:hypothetical protein GIB67_036784 [Kingdonia uniflora]
MNRSIRAEESLLFGKRGQESRMRVDRKQQGRSNVVGSVMKEKEEELALFLEMRKREKERDNMLSLQSSEEFDAPLETKPGSFPIFNIVQSTTTRKTPTDDFLNFDNDKNDYDWLLTPPGTPLFPSLEEPQRTVMSQLGTPNSRQPILNSRLANPQPAPTLRGSLLSRQPTLVPGLNSSSTGTNRRPSSSGGLSSSSSRPATPTGRTSSRPATPTGRPSLPPSAKPSRSSTPTSRATIPSSRPSAPPPTRSSTSSARSSTPTRSTILVSRPTISAPKPAVSASKPTVSTPKTISRSATPTRRPPSTTSSMSNVSAPPSRSSSVTRSGPSSSTRNPVPSRGTSPTPKSRPWKPSEMPGFSLDAPPNLRTSMPDRPVSASRGRPGAPSSRSSSVEPVPNGRPRRQSCSPSRGCAPNGSIHNSGSSVPAVSRARSNVNDNVSPGMIGTKMVERVVNMRKLAPPMQDKQQFTQNNPAGKSSSSPDSSGFGRNLSKKSLDMALRHMDIRRSIPGNLGPLMTKIPASSMYSVRSGPARSRAVSVSDSPLATSSNASSEHSVNNIHNLYVEGSEVEDNNDVGSENGFRSSPASQHGRILSNYPFEEKFARDSLNSLSDSRKLSSRSSSVTRSGPTPTSSTRNRVPSLGTSPTPKSKQRNPSEFSFSAPSNLRTSMPERPVTASKGKPGAPSARSSSIEPIPNGRPRRQSYSPSRRRATNGSTLICGSSIAAVSQVRSNGNDPTEKLSSSPDSSDYGRNISNKSLDTTLGHMDIRGNVPGGLVPLMTEIPASSMCTVGSGSARRRTVSVSDSPLATSSNASSEYSVNNINTLNVEESEIEDINDVGRLTEDPAHPPQQVNLAGERSINSYT